MELLVDVLIEHPSFIKLFIAMKSCLASLNKLCFSQHAMWIANHESQDDSPMEVLCRIPSSSFIQYKSMSAVECVINFKPLIRFFKKTNNVASVRLCIPLRENESERDTLQVYVKRNDESWNVETGLAIQALRHLPPDIPDDDMWVFFNEHSAREMPSSILNEWMSCMFTNKVRQVHIYFGDNVIEMKGLNQDGILDVYQLPTEKEDQDRKDSTPFKPATGVFSAKLMRQLSQAAEVSSVVRLYMQDDLPAIGILYPVSTIPRMKGKKNQMQVNIGTEMAVLQYALAKLPSEEISLPMVGL